MLPLKAGRGGLLVFDALVDVLFCGAGGPVFVCCAIVWIESKTIRDRMNLFIVRQPANFLLPLYT
jgi:hypothetical protein